MPCRSDWPSPPGQQQRNQQAANLLVSLYELTKKPVSEALRKEVVNCYCEIDFVKTLCGLLKAMKPKERDRVIYNAKDKRSRELADWWENHLEQDRRREEEEMRKKHLIDLRLGALAKLTQAEIEALGISPFRISRWEKGEE